MLVSISALHPIQQGARRSKEQIGYWFETARSHMSVHGHMHTHVYPGVYTHEHNHTDNRAHLNDWPTSVQVSSIGADDVLNPLNLFWGVLFWKKRAEEELQRSGLDYTIVRPGGALGWEWGEQGGEVLI